MSTPIHRADIKDHVAEVKQDCTSQMSNEIAAADFFMVDATDTNAYEEYSKYLTDAELRQCFKRADSNS